MPRGIISKNSNPQVDHSELYAKTVKAADGKIAMASHIIVLLLKVEWLGMPGLPIVIT